LKSKNDKKAPSLFLIFLSTVILFKSLVVKKVLEKADILIAVSFYVKRKLVEGGFNKNQIKVVYNPVVVNKHDIVQSSNAHHVLFVGRLDIKKGIELLIMAMQSIREKYPRAFLTIVGDGPQKKHCERLVNQLNMESCVKFLGYVSENTLMDLYQSCSVVVVPSIWPQPFGIVVAEAILCRRPVVASNIGGIPELINKKTGILVPPGDVSALAEAITSIIENKVSIESDTIIHEKLSPCRITEHVLNVINAVTETRSDYLT
jgi:glycosyltransferase involved in cell wall biosynthesis